MQYIPTRCPVRWPLVLIVYRGSFNGLAGISFIFSPQFYYSINFRDRVCADGARRRLSFGGGGPAHVLQRRAAACRKALVVFIVLLGIRKFQKQLL